MKNTVSLFNNCKQYIILAISYIKTFGLMLLFICIMLLVGVKCFKREAVLNAVLCSGTNIHVEENIKCELLDLMKVYPVFNEDNYIVCEVNKKEKIKEEVKTCDTSKFDASAVDAIGNIITIDKPNLRKIDTKNYTRIDIYGVKILDYSSKKIDYQKLMDMNVNLTKKSDSILLYCTHTSETYMNSENFVFKYSGNYRSKNASYNMLSVGNILANTLKDRGITNVFDTTAHDYTSYDNSYKNSMKSINNNLKKVSRFGMLIDVHRDAAADLSFAPKIKINGKSTAQLMLVIGVGYEGFPNKYWEKNLSLALHIAKLGEEMYPGLFRHVLVRDARYNQHLSAGSILVEVGATGNTLEEAYYGARCFANIIAKLYK